MFCVGRLACACGRVDVCVLTFRKLCQLTFVLRVAAGSDNDESMYLFEMIVGVVMIIYYVRHFDCRFVCVCVVALFAVFLTILFY